MRLTIWRHAAINDVCRFVLCTFRVLCPNLGLVFAVSFWVCLCPGHGSFLLSFQHTAHQHTVNGVWLRVQNSQHRLLLLPLPTMA
jgi:hypothetical protein